MPFFVLPVKFDISGLRPIANEPSKCFLVFKLSIEYIFVVQFFDLKKNFSGHILLLQIYLYQSARGSDYEIHSKYAEWRIHTDGENKIFPTSLLKQFYFMASNFFGSKCENDNKKLILYFDIRKYRRKPTLTKDEL